MAIMEAPTATATATARLSREEVVKAHDELRKALVAGDSEATLGYAETLATFAANARRVHGTFKRWSANNLLLLEAQRRRRHLSHVGLYAGVRQWAKMDRQVRPDATPLTIWVYSGRDDEDTTTGQAQANQPQANQPQANQPQANQAQPPSAAPARTVRHTFRGFIPRDVYDYTDTVSTIDEFVEPNWAVPLAAGDRATLDRLVASSPVPVNFIDFGAHVENGRLDDNGIAVRDEMPIGNRISTLAHELAHHHLGHLAATAAAKRSEKDTVRAGCEAEAGLAQWLVMKMLGLDEQVGNDVTIAAADYLRSWTDPETGEEIAGHKKREKLLGARLGRALEAAEAILDAYLATA